MRFTTASAAALLLVAGAAAPAFGKGHDQPADPAQSFGQKNAHDSYFVSEDARAETDDEKAVEGSEISTAAPTNDRGPANPPKGKPE